MNNSFDGLLYVNAHKSIWKLIHNGIVLSWVSIFNLQLKQDWLFGNWYFLVDFNSYPFFMKWNPDYKSYVARQKIDRVFDAMRKELP